MIKKIGDIIKNNSSFLVVSHINPDGDAIGSSLAMYSVLKDMGKEVYLENPTKPIPQVYSFLEDYDKFELVSNKKNVDVIFILDVAEINRCEIDKNYTRGKLVVNIDHHKTNTDFGDINLIDKDAAATGCILWSIFEENNFIVSKKTATYLYVSILTDTGSFRYASTTPRTFKIASKLLEKGVEPWFVAYNVYETRLLKELKLLGLVLETLKTYYEGKLAVLYITRDMFIKTDTTAENAEGFVNFARSVRDAEVGVLLREDEPGVFKISIRSKDRVDVSEAAGAFGGGGHKNAAGGTIYGTLNQASQKILEAFSFLG